jgi:single-strand DNA-binding protein
MSDTTILTGNLGKDPLVKYLPSGTPYTTFSVASNHRYKDETGNVIEQTSWFNISAYRKLGDVCQKYLKKGRKVLVRGRVISDRETGGPRVYKRKDGTYGASHELFAEYVEFLDKGEGNGSAAAVGEPPEVGEGAPIPPPAGEEEIPF